MVLYIYNHRHERAADLSCFNSQLPEFKKSRKAGKAFRLWRTCRTLSFTPVYSGPSLPVDIGVVEVGLASEAHQETLWQQKME